MTAISASAHLVKLGNGEYTAASVRADPTDATKLALVKEKDGNYGTSPPSVASSGNAATQSSSNVQAALSSFKLGGQ
jgi:hypothetical protein